MFPKLLRLKTIIYQQKPLKISVKTGNYGYNRKFFQQKLTKLLMALKK